MAKRFEAIDFMALTLVRTVEAVLNTARVLKNAPAPYGTSIGRGRDSEVLAEWTNSVFLGLSTDDTKNAAIKVPELGNLQLDFKASSLLHRNTEVHGNQLDFSAPSTEIVTELPEIVHEGNLRKTLFETLNGFTREVGCNWNGPLHKALKSKFELTLNSGSVPYAEIVLSTSEETGAKWLMRGVYFSGATHEPARLWQNPIKRQSVINVRHIEMLAILYADTMRKVNGFDQGDVPAPSIEELLAQKSSNVSEETSNDVGSSDDESDVPTVLGAASSNAAPGDEDQISPARETMPSRACDVPMDQNDRKSTDQFCSRGGNPIGATVDERMRESKNAQAHYDCIAGRSLQLFGDNRHDRTQERTQADFRRSTRACA